MPSLSSVIHYVRTRLATRNQQPTTMSTNIQIFVDQQRIPYSNSVAAVCCFLPKPTHTHLQTTPNKSVWSSIRCNRHSQPQHRQLLLQTTRERTNERCIKCRHYLASDNDVPIIIIIIIMSPIIKRANIPWKIMTTSATYHTTKRFIITNTATNRQHETTT